MALGNGNGRPLQIALGVGGILVGLLGALAADRLRVAEDSATLRARLEAVEVGLQRAIDSPPREISIPTRRILDAHQERLQELRQGLSALSSRVGQLERELARVQALRGDR